MHVCTGILGQLSRELGWANFLFHTYSLFTPEDGVGLPTLESPPHALPTLRMLPETQPGHYGVENA